MTDDDVLLTLSPYTVFGH